jgi:Mor family transcriptional regulator
MRWLDHDDKLNLMSTHYTHRRNHARNLEIIALKRLGETVQALASRFDLSVVQVYRITNKRRHSETV